MSFCLNHDVFVPSESVMSTQGFTAALLNADEDSNLMFHLSELLMSVNTRVSSLGSSGQKHLSVFGSSLILTDRKCVIHELHFCEKVSCCVSCLWTNTSVPAEDLVPSTCPYRTSRCLFSVNAAPGPSTCCSVFVQFVVCPGKRSTHGVLLLFPPFTECETLTLCCCSQRGADSSCSWTLSSN